MNTDGWGVWLSSTVMVGIEGRPRSVWDDGTPLARDVDDAVLSVARGPPRKAEAVEVEAETSAALNALNGGAPELLFRRDELGGSSSCGGGGVRLREIDQDFLLGASPSCDPRCESRDEQEEIGATEEGDDERFDEFDGRVASRASIVEGPGPGAARISGVLSDTAIAPEAGVASACFFFSSASFF